MDQFPPPPPRHPRSAFASSASIDFAAMSSPPTAPDDDSDSDAQLANALAQLEAEQSPEPSPPSPSPPPLPPPPIRTRRSSQSSSSSPLDRRLQHLQDIEIAQLLDRVGHRLTDVRIAQAVDVRLAVEYPTTETFTNPTTGRVDWLGYVVAYTSCLVADLVPTSLLEEPTSSPTNPDFSLTDLRGQLERFYVLCPPPIWQRLVLSHLASLWRWDDPTRTATCFGAYLVLWWYDLLLLAPCVALTALVIKASFFFPPSVEQLVRLAEDRNARSRDARVLGKQLNASSLFGYAGQGVKGIWSDLRARMRDVEREEEGITGDGELVDEERSRSAMAASAQTPKSALSHLVASAAVLSTSTAAPSSTPTFAPKSAGTGSEDQQEEQKEELQDPARRGPGGKEGDGDVSLYRLLRNLTATFGPNAILWLGELNDLGERIKKCVPLAHTRSSPRPVGD